MNIDRLQQLLRIFASKRLAVIGDIMLDKFIWGRVYKISPEAPVPVVEVQSESYYPGGAANVARNLKPFCQSVHIFGLVGRDSAGEHISQLLRNEGILTGLVRQKDFSTIVKTRIIARQQQIVRVDRENRNFTTTDTTNRTILNMFEQLLPSLDGVVFEDYGKGLINQDLIACLCHMANRKGITIAVDPSSSNALDWTGVTVVKPNRSEVFDCAGVPSSRPRPTSVSINPVEDLQLLRACKRLQIRWKLPQLLITLGEQGMLLLQPSLPPYHIPTRAREVFDVSGAGDTTIALYTLALCADAAPKEAAELSNHAAGVVVGKLGTATLTTQELEESFKQYGDGS